MRKVYCPHCNHTLTPWEGYKVLNFKRLTCPNCQSVLRPLWKSSKKPLWQRRLIILGWSFPALLAMTVVWFQPAWWLYLILGLVGFHVLALVWVCVSGYYQVQVEA